jgi:hypothetical protein
VLDAALVQQQEVELHRLARGGLVVGQHHQFGDQPGQLGVVGEVGCRFGGVLAQPGDSRSARHREVGVGQAVEVLLALLRQRDAHRQQRPLAALARGQLGRAAWLRRRRLAAAPAGARTGRLRLTAAQGLRRDHSPHHHRRLEVEPLRHLAHEVVAARRLPHRRQHRRHLVQRPVTLHRRGDVGAVEHQPDLEGVELDGGVDQGAEALGPARRGHHFRRVLAGRHPRHPQAHLAPGRDPLRPQHRLLPGGVGVEGQHHLLDHARERRHLVAGDRRPHHRHRLLDPGLMQGEDIGVPLDHDRAVGLGDRRFRLVDPIEQLALVEEVGLRRVHVLGALVVAHRPAAEAENAAAAVTDREHDASAETVVLAPVAVALDEADAVQLLGAEAGLLAADEDLVPGAGRVADAEGAQSLLAEAALGQVPARLLRLRRLPEVAGVVGGDAVQQLLEAAALLAAGLGPRVLLLARDLDPVAVGQELDRLGKPEPVLLFDELDHVAADPAAEAVVELFLGIDRERGGALVVERTEAGVAGAGAAQIGVSGDHLDDVRRLLDPVEALGGDQRH